MLYKKIRVGSVYTEESFDTILNMGYESEKSPMGERVKAELETYLIKSIEKLYTKHETKICFCL